MGRYLGKLFYQTIDIGSLGIFVIDKRLEKLAYILVNHSLGIKKNDLFLISGSSVASPLILEVYKQALKRGAFPYTRVAVDGLPETFYNNASEKQLKYIPPYFTSFPGPIHLILLL